MKPQVPEGYTVKYEHVRRLRGGGTPQPKGGWTFARLYDANDVLVASGASTCHENDNFNKRIGRNIALGRAVKYLG